ncbi:hypothetical protein OC834_005167 [Tilletia horrida]|nr:hypothetical protein OC834_005167 [Tilletia horrida]
MAHQPHHRAASPSSPTGTGSSGPDRRRSVASSASSGSLRGIPIDVANNLVAASTAGPPVSASPPVAGRSASSHHFAHSGHGPHSAHIVRAKPAVRSSNPGWRASVCGPSATATVAAASQGLDSPTLGRDGQAQQPASYVYGYAGIHHTPASPSLSTRTSLSSTSAAAAPSGAPAAGSVGMSATGASAGTSQTSQQQQQQQQQRQQQQQQQQQHQHPMTGTSSEMSATGRSVQSHHGSGSGGESDHQYSHMSGTSRQNVAMAAFNWNSLPVTGSMSGMGLTSGAGMTGPSASRDGTSHLDGPGPHPLDVRFGLGEESLAHDLISDSRSPSSLGLDHPPTDGIISEIPVLSPPFGEYGLEGDPEDGVSPRTGGGGFVPAQTDLSPTAQPKSPPAVSNLLQRRFEHEMRSRNMSESLSPGPRFGRSGEGSGAGGPGIGGFSGSATLSDRGLQFSPLRQSHSGASRAEVPSHLSPRSGSSGFSPTSPSPSHSPGQQDGPRTGEKRNHGPGSVSRDGPAVRAPPPLRLIPAPPTPSIAGVGNEGKYDWANFVFAYSRGRWDPHRLPRPPGRSTLHPGVKTKITQPQPYVTAMETSLSDSGREGGATSGALGAKKSADGAGSGSRDQVLSSAGLVASPLTNAQRLHPDDAGLRPMGGGLGSGTASAPGFSISPASPLDGEAADVDPIDAAALGARRPSLTYVADSPPAAADAAGTGAGSAPKTANANAAPRKSVTAEEAAAMVAAASHTAQILLREREMAERCQELEHAECEDPAGQAGVPSGASGGEGRDIGDRALAVGAVDEDGSFPCATTFTSPFTSVAIRNMLETTTGATTAADAHGPGRTAAGSQDPHVTPVMPVPLSPAASAPADRGLPSEGHHVPPMGPSSLTGPAVDHRALTLSAALGSHGGAQRSQTYGGSEQKFNPLAYNRNSGAFAKSREFPLHSRDDSDRSDLDRSTGFRDRPAADGHGSQGDLHTQSMPAKKQEPEMWESSSIGLSNRSSAKPDDVPEQSESGEDSAVTETERTPAHPGGFQLDAESQRKVEALAKKDFKEQLKQSVGVLPPVAQTSDKSTLGAALADRESGDSLPVPQRPGPTPVQVSPTVSSDGSSVQKKKKKAAPSAVDGPQHSSSALSTHSGSGSSSAGSFHNPPLHRRRRPSPTTNKSTPPGSSAGLARNFQLPHGLASSSSSPSASVRALGLGAVTVGSTSSRGSPEGADGASTGDDVRPGAGGVSRRLLKGQKAAPRSNSSPSMPRIKQDALGIDEAVEYDSEYGDSALDTSSPAPSPAPVVQHTVSEKLKSAGKHKEEPEELSVESVDSQLSKAPSHSGNTETMTRHASYSGSPTPRSPTEHPESATSSTRGGSSSTKKKRRPGSSGGLHRSLMNSPYMTVAGNNNSGWGSSGLDSSTVAELRMAASRRKSLETHPPVLLGLANASSTRDGQGNQGGPSEDQPSGSSSKVNLNVAKQSGAALSLSGKLPLSTMAQSKGSGTAANAAASALGMLKLQLTHSLSFPPDKEVQELWAKQAESSGEKEKEKDEGSRKGKSSHDSASSKSSGRMHNSESVLSYTLKQIADDGEDVWEKSEKITTTKRTVERVHSRRESEKQTKDKVSTVQSQDFAHAESGSLSPFSKPVESSTLPAVASIGNTSLNLPPPVRSSTVIPPSSDRVLVPAVAASTHDLASTAQGQHPDSTASTLDAYNSSTMQCDLRSFSTAQPEQEPAFARNRPNFLPSGSAALNAYLTAGGRAEAFYIQNGYLPAIMPPNELERRQALKRYGPPKLAGNAHFDRIAHLVKLVFNTKLVLVSLVGENEQIFQTESGGGGSVTLQALQRLAKSRDCSFCAHAILQENDEPIVILDASRDWRFAGNPLVLGPPNIRFYAGSPLRTSDGYNIGSLCIIDDRPWTEFSPRQRHTLKEFARVVMREMELLRDRIQLGLRDSMQRSIESFTRECVEMDLEETTPAPPKVEETRTGDGSNSQGSNSSGQTSTVGIHRVYDMAARAMKDALQVSGAIVFDLSHLELLDTITSADVDDSDGQHSIFFPGPLHNAEFASTMHSPPSVSTRSREMSIQSEGSMGRYPDALRRASDESVQYRVQQHHARLVPPMAVLGSSETLPPPDTREDPVPLSHHVKVAEFLRVHRAGRYFPFVPLPFQHLLPAGMANVLLVPVFGLNKQPFAMLCAYNQDEEAAPSLDELKESGLQYLRAIGMIVLSAVLKKDIVLADKAKSHFISNISHELRTPLHGILAAAELLAETKLNSTQGSYLETVEACGKSLLELVNHVLDFTKLSGNSRSHMARQNEKTRCDLVKLIQEVCESSWIGSIAKTLENKHSGIGSVYAPPQGLESDDTSKKSIGGAAKMRETGVETVIDISMREAGWLVQCDAGGIRRVLMNLIGNSLKFTTAGFVHVSLREIQSTDTHVVVELGVTDTGRGISRAFLEEQLFHPFTQENPLGTGTGLGLSIVNSIVQSPALNGKIDVWSTEGQGTEIRVTCELELSPATSGEGVVYQPALRVQRQYSISLLSFGYTRGEEDLKEVVKSYLADWWGFDVLESINPNLVPAQLGDLVVLNEDATPLRQIAQRGGQLPPVIVLTSSRGDASIANACEAYHAAGGVARLLFKPAGPAKLESVLDFCLQCLERIRRGDPPDPQDTKPSTPLPSPSPSPRESPAWRPGLEQQKSYFGPTADPVTGTDIAKRNDKAGATPTDDTTPGSWNDLTPKPKGVASPSAVHKHSPHISPHPPELSSTLLIRRHSTESKVAHQSSDPGTPSASMSGTSSTSSSGTVTKTTRPLLPARSITYHEPRLHKHVLMSPHPAIRRGEGQDYFGFVSSGGGTPTERDPGSLPSSPGSTISLEGGEGAVLKTAVQSSASSSSSSSSSSRSSGKMKKQLKILSVEDNPINRRVIQAFLAKMGIEYVEATDGMQGVKAFAAHPPHYFDVILMDLSMPVLDGIGATAAIRRIELDRERAAAASASVGGPMTQTNTTTTTSSSTSTEAAGSGSNKVSPGAQSATSSTSSSSTSMFTTASTSANSSESAGGASNVSATAAAAIAAAVSASGPPSRLPHPRTRVKIFALTGRSTDEDKRKAFATGADGYIVKPLSFKVLSSLLKMLAR